MFTGLVQGQGRLVAKGATADPIWTIASPLAHKMSLGASVACQGICLTVITYTEADFQVQLSAETLNKTNAHAWQAGQLINLEPSLRLGDELGGHLVSGHVDSTTTILSREQVGDSWRFVFALPPTLGRLLAPKGSITLDGVSLTINEVDQHSFSVNIIPHTYQVTSFGQAQVGQLVNVEVDMLARYLDRWLSQRVLPH